MPKVLFFSPRSLLPLVLFTVRLGPIRLRTDGPRMDRRSAIPSSAAPLAPPLRLASRACTNILRLVRPQFVSDNT